MLAEQLREDGFDARAYHGKMDVKQKKENQDAFMAVSYTHLDVYKRQAQLWRRESVGCRFAPLPFLEPFGNFVRKR